MNYQKQQHPQQVMGNPSKSTHPKNNSNEWALVMMGQMQQAPQGMMPNTPSPRCIPVLPEPRPIDMQ